MKQVPTFNEFFTEAEAGLRPTDPTGGTGTRPRGRVHYKQEELERAEVGEDPRSLKQVRDTGAGYRPFPGMGKGPFARKVTKAGVDIFKPQFSIGHGNDIVGRNLNKMFTEPFETHPWWYKSGKEVASKKPWKFKYKTGQGPDQHRFASANLPA